MPRDMHQIPATMGAIVNRLDQQIDRHVEYRFRHYSMYAFFMYALTSKLSKEQDSKLNIDLSRYVVKKATHQIGVGHRRSSAEYSEFIRRADVLEIFTNTFKDVDAAHTCGLGASPLLQVAVAKSKDKHTQPLHQGLLAAMRTTANMPKLVNVGPDKIIDKVHADNILEHLTTTSVANPLLGTGALTNYIRRARLAMTAYREGKLSQGRLGLAACASVYIDFYDNHQRVERVFTDIYRGYYDECRDYAIDIKLILG